MILGYVEVKDIGANLDRVLKSEQIQRRWSALQKHRRHRLPSIHPDRWAKVKCWIAQSLAFPERPRKPHDPCQCPTRRRTVSKNCFTAFFSSPPQGLAKSGMQLAVALATRSKTAARLSGRGDDPAGKGENKKANSHALFDVFHDQVFHELTLQGILGRLRADAGLQPLPARS